ncbi:BON domain-containing protein [uncultured Ramlibacter sp.]|uniref:BON domain-containing protein n=1 Tax=uncultured Ramlibacter sp. TaxID=260755 RepID=UPI002628B5FF|nr:BON domain-containing protein [uncultured Ramlibacter sp.]
MKTIQQTSLIAVASLAALLALGGCNRNDERTAGQQLDSAIAKSGEAADKAKADAKVAAAKTEDAMKDAADATRTAGANAVSKLDDAGITAKVNAGLAADKDLSAIKINVDTAGGVVTLTGPVPSATAKERASDIAKNVKDVKSVNNQLSVTAG